MTLSNDFVAVLNADQMQDRLTALLENYTEIHTTPANVETLAVMASAVCGGTLASYDPVAILIRNLILEARYMGPDALLSKDMIVNNIESTRQTMERAIGKFATSEQVVRAKLALCFSLDQIAKVSPRHAQPANHTAEL